MGSKLDQTIDFLDEMFGGNISCYYAILETFAIHLDRQDNIKYKIYNMSEFINLTLQQKYKKSMQMYWLELLGSLHLAATVSLLRHSNWMEGIVFGAKSNNYILFAASLRGFIESAADSYYSLKDKPIIIANNFKEIKLAVDGKQEKKLLADEFEESLIHFRAARKTKKIEMKPDFIDARTNREYLDALDKQGTKLIHECYSELCELTHPASKSVYSYIEEALDEGDISINLRINQGKNSINDLYKRYQECIEHIFQYSSNIPLVALKILNYFLIKDLYTAYIEHPIVNNEFFNDISNWKEIKEMIEKQL